jgi:transposase
MMYPLVRDLAAAGAPVRVPVAVTCRVLNLARQPYYRWQCLAEAGRRGWAVAFGGFSPFTPDETRMHSAGDVERTKAINTLTALVRSVDLGVDARKALTSAQITAIAGWRTRDEDPATAACRREAIRLASRICDLGRDLAANMAELRRFTAAEVPELLELPGVGPVVAGTILLAWSHPGRVRSEAAFAALAGTSPIPASSGNTIRHRLNPGRRPAAEPGADHDCVGADAPPPSNPCLREQTPRRRPNDQRDHAHPQALHRPPGLPS